MPRAVAAVAHPSLPSPRNARRWENFISLLAVTPKETWTTGDSLRFVVNLDML